VTMAFEKFYKNHIDVDICKSDMKFQIDPTRRGNWIDGLFYSIGYNLTEEEKQQMPFNRVGFLKDVNMQKDQITYTIFNNPNGISKISSKRPLTYKTEDIKVKAYLNFKITEVVSRRELTPNNLICTTDYFLYRYNGRTDVLYCHKYKKKEQGKEVEKKTYYTINVFGVEGKFKPCKMGKMRMTIEQAEKYMCGIIALRNTPENIKKYGENYITEKDLIRLVQMVESAIHPKIMSRL